jgi:virulence-associated protein VapD
MKRWRADRSRSSQLAVFPSVGHNTKWPAWENGRGTRMYAICFDLDTEALARHYPGNSPNNGYAEIRNVLAQHGFSWQQGTVYFGDEHATPVTCILAVQAVQAACPWFNRVVSDIRMLRIEENNDLRPALGEPQLFDQVASGS